MQGERPVSVTRRTEAQQIEQPLATIWHTLEDRQVMARLAVDTAMGLSAAESAQRLQLSCQL